MDKSATYHSQGAVHALASLGFSENQISRKLQSDGIRKEAADILTKEALLGSAIGGVLRAGGKLLAGKGANLARAGTSRMMAPAQAGAQGILGRGIASAQQTAGRTGLQIGRGIASSGRAFQKNPMATLGRGALEAGKGAIFAGGKGAGGILGKGMFGASLASSLSNPSQIQMPQAYGGLTRYPSPYGQQ